MRACPTGVGVLKGTDGALSAWLAYVMDTNTLLIIVVVILVLGGGGFFFRGRRR